MGRVRARADHRGRCCGWCAGRWPVLPRGYRPRIELPGRCRFMGFSGRTPASRLHNSIANLHRRIYFFKTHSEPPSPLAALAGTLVTDRAIRYSGVVQIGAERRPNDLPAFGKEPARGWHRHCWNARYGRRGHHGPGSVASRHEACLAYRRVGGSRGRHSPRRQSACHWIRPVDRLADGGSCAIRCSGRRDSSEPGYGYRRRIACSSREAIGSICNGA